MSEDEEELTCLASRTNSRTGTPTNVVDGAGDGGIGIVALE